MQKILIFFFELNNLVIMRLLFPDFLILFLVQSGNNILQFFLKDIFFILY